MPDYAGKADGLSIDQLVAYYCPGVVYADGVTTYKGLAGTYARYTVPSRGEPTRFRLATTVDDPDAKGTFTGTWADDETGALTSHAGTFMAVGDNPAIGAAIGFDFTGDAGIDKVYFVLGLRRSWGVLNGLCLAGSETPIFMRRVYF